MKICSCCGIKKPLIDFHKQKDCIGGHRSKCKSCVKINKKQQYQKTKDLYKERNRVWREKNDRTSYHAKYREENKEKIKQYFINSRHISAKNRSIRRSRLLQRTPSWLSKADIFEMSYERVEE
jgi:hypothetical protein